MVQNNVSTTVVEKEKNAAKPVAASGGLAYRITPKRFVEETRAEIQKVTWPTRERVLQSSVLILVIVVFYSVVVSSADGVFAALLGAMGRR